MSEKQEQIETLENLELTEQEETELLAEFIREAREKNGLDQ